jgi:hypothetical protein
MHIHVPPHTLRRLSRNSSSFQLYVPACSTARAPASSASTVLPATVNEPRSYYWPERAFGNLLTLLLALLLLFLLFLPLLLLVQLRQRLCPQPKPHLQLLLFLTLLLPLHQVSTRAPYTTARKSYLESLQGSICAYAYHSHQPRQTTSGLYFIHYAQAHQCQAFRRYTCTWSLWLYSCSFGCARRQRKGSKDAASSKRIRSETSPPAVLPPPVAIYQPQPQSGSQIAPCGPDMSF